MDINLIQKDTDTAIIIHMAGFNQNIPVPGGQMNPVPHVSDKQGAECGHQGIFELYPIGINMIPYNFKSIDQGHPLFIPG